MDGEYETERWRGSVTERLNQLEQRTANLFKITDTFALTIQALALSINTIAVKMSLYAAIGGFVGGGIMSALVSYILRR